MTENKTDGAVDALVDIEKKTDTQKTAEQIADENYLNGLKTSIDEGIKTDGASYDETPKITDSESLSGLFQILGAVLIFMQLKNTAAVLDKNNCDNLAAATVPVLNKYPWGLKVINFLRTGAGIEEGFLLMTAAPIAMAMMKAYAIDTKPPINEKEVKDAPKNNSEWQDAETQKGSRFQNA